MTIFPTKWRAKGRNKVGSWAPTSWICLNLMFDGDSNPFRITYQACLVSKSRHLCWKLETNGDEILEWRISLQRSPNSWWWRATENIASQFKSHPPFKGASKKTTPGCLDDIQVMLNTTLLSRGDSKEVGNLCLVGGGFKGTFFSKMFTNKPLKGKMNQSHFDLNIFVVESRQLWKSHRNFPNHHLPMLKPANTNWAMKKDLVV